MKRLLTALALGLAAISFTTPARAQETGRIEGTVILANSDAPLHGARVLVIGLGHSALTDEQGRFRFEGVPVGPHELLAVREHLQAGRQTVDVVAGETTQVHFTLMLAAVHEEVTVTATGRETTAFDAFNNVQVLDSIDLAQNMAGTLGEVLENEPGIAKRSFGPGSSRPIIRGFDNDRVLIMQDGVRTGDLSSQSGDHGVSIDPASLQKVEILKGPATLLYGSNAIGGVVNTITPQQQFYENPPQELRGQINGDLGSTNDQLGAGANFQYGGEHFMTWFGGGGRRTSAYGTPAGTVENSQTEQLNGRFGAGWFTDGGWLSGSYQVEDGLYGVPSTGGHHGHEGDATDGEDEDVLTELDQRRQAIRIDGGLRNLERGPFESVKGSFTFIDWTHDEVENFVDSGVREIGTTFNNETYIGRVEVQQSHAGRLNGQFGVWGQHRDYAAIGEEALSPPTKQTGLAAFAYEELEYDTFSLQFGARLEHNRYRPEATPAAAETGSPEARPREFTGVSGSVGLRVPWADDRAALVASFSSSYRAPALEELYNFGPHVGNLSFEIGNPNLEHERSNGGEISLRLNSGMVHGQASLFYYAISDYIFGALTGEVVDDFQEVVYTQGDSRYVGADMAVSLHLSARWRLHLGGGLVSAKLTATDEHLPRIPPANARIALDWTPANGMQVRPELLLAAAQNKVFGIETPTPGYTTANLLVSYTVAGPKRMHVFTLKGTNLSDTLYRNHTSLIKDEAAEMGRRVILTYALRLF